ncbi:MAG: hypothetical protein QF805_08635 [Pirellulaceae bacterium]|jgi:hypothetical protein|nr:hypothetical protein [Pirellulaceae bacterium]
MAQFHASSPTGNGIRDPQGDALCVKRSRREQRRRLAEAVQQWLLGALFQLPAIAPARVAVLMPERRE